MRKCGNEINYHMKINALNNQPNVKLRVISAVNAVHSNVRISNKENRFLQNDYGKLMTF